MHLAFIDPDRIRTVSIVDGDGNALTDRLPVTAARKDDATVSLYGLPDFAGTVEGAYREPIHLACWDADGKLVAAPIISDIDRELFPGDRVSIPDTLGG